MSSYFLPQRVSQMYHFCDVFWSPISWMSILYLCFYISTVLAILALKGKKTPAGKAPMALQVFLGLSNWNENLFG